MNALISFLVQIAILAKRATMGGLVGHSALGLNIALVMDDATEPLGLVCASRVGQGQTAQTEIGP